MDRAYDAAPIKQHSRKLNHVPIIETNPRGNAGLKQEPADEAKRLRRVGHRMAELVRYGERSTAERVNSGLKDNHGGRSGRVRGPDKVACHLMSAILRSTVLQLVHLTAFCGLLASLGCGQSARNALGLPKSGEKRQLTARCGREADDAGQILPCVVTCG
jgi:hypothetical protein